MTNSRYLTKSRFKLGLECSTKLFYTNKNEYSNANLDDPFLKALANGGFQVGELAKCYFENGIEVKELNKEKALSQTNELLTKKNVIIFEAAIKFKNLFIRTDILEKKDNEINLYEVKSKSTNPNTFYDELWNKTELKKNKYKLNKDWQPYIYDIAFQAFVLKNCFPDFKVNAFLMCADVSQLATVDGLNQKFILQTDGNNRTFAKTNGDVSKKSLGNEILVKLDLNEAISKIFKNEEKSDVLNGKNFEDLIWYLTENYEKDIKIKPEVGSHCKKCEFRSSEEDKKCGFNECWQDNHGLNQDELKRPFVFDLWNFKGSDKLIAQGKHLLEELEPDDIKPKSKSKVEKVKEKNGLDNSERQLLQIEKVKNSDMSSFIDLQGLNEEFSKFKYPLHMIDFETCMVAIPFNKGRHPYEQIAFQFSHHIIYEDGKVEHKDEFILNQPGIFPNFEFIRALKKALATDNGTIFRYSNHENTVLNQIKTMLTESTETDKHELISFIETITCEKENDSKTYTRIGPRNMIDLCDLVKKYYYSPMTKGSNSIKYVLPAILNESKHIQSKYSFPIYNSKNFKQHTWIKFDQAGSVLDPYKTLPPIFDQYDYDTLELVMSDDDIRNGGAAMTAYAMMQFTHMSPQEREKVTQSLLRYCELDTLAMVMIYEFWKHLIDEAGKVKKKVSRVG